MNYFKSYFFGGSYWASYYFAGSGYIFFENRDSLVMGMEAQTAAQMGGVLIE